MDKDARYMAAKCRRLAETLQEHDARTLRELAAEYDRLAAGKGADVLARRDADKC